MDGPVMFVITEFDCICLNFFLNFFMSKIKSINTTCKKLLHQYFWLWRPRSLIHTVELKAFVYSANLRWFYVCSFKSYSPLRIRKNIFFLSINFFCLWSLKMLINEQSRMTDTSLTFHFWANIYSNETFL